MWVQRLIRGDIRNGDLANLFLYARDRSDGRQSVAEIGAFTAHHNERERGLVTEATREWAAVIAFHAPALTGQRSIMDFARLPSVTVEYLRAMKNRIEHRPMKQAIGIDRKHAFRLIETIVSGLRKNQDGTFYWDLPIDGEVVDVFRYVSSRMQIKPTITGARLVEDLFSVLRSGGAVSRDEIRDSPHLSVAFQAYAISVMHKSVIMLGDQRKAELVASRNPHGMLVSVGVPFTLNEKPQTFIGIPIFTTDIIPEQCCEPEMLDNTDWEEDLEVTSNGRLGFIS